MGPLYAYSLAPVLSVALLLCFTAALRGTNARGLALYCLAVAAWCTALLLLCIPETLTLGQRTSAVGTFVVATYLHAAYDVTGQKSYALLALAYGVAVVITALGIVFPGMLFDPVAHTRGPMFWPAMALAVTASSVPLGQLLRGFRATQGERRATMLWLLLAGAVGLGGAWLNAVLLSSGRPLPFGLFLVLASLLVLGNVIRAHQSAADRRLLDRSLLYAAVTAFVSAGFLFGVLSLLGRSGEPLAGEYRAGALFLFFMAALAFEPVRQQLVEWAGRRLLKHRAASVDLARALAEHEQRADQATRLAELGVFASAVAHEVRNPLGVLAAHLKLLERQGADAATVDAMREQLDRAARFVDDLLEYGRPRPLELRMVDVAATVELAFSAAKQALGPLALDVALTSRHAEPAALLEADQAQLTQVLLVLFENALLAVADAPAKALRVESAIEGERLRLSVEDSGPGIAPEVRERLFQPFVTGRKREGRRAGTGLGLAIARGIVERHGGSIRAGTGSLGGAKFDLELPRTQPVLGTAAASPGA